MTFHIDLKKYTPDLWKEFEGISNSWGTIQNYVEKYPKDGELFIVKEDNYIDKDYLIDFTNFYARCFDEIDKKVTRIHFFKSEESKLKALFSSLGKDEDFDTITKQINKEYLGFIIKKPMFKGAIGSFNGAIGRTVLRRYPKEADVNNVRILNVYKQNKINLFGIPLKLKSLPFQEQDRAVSACATISIWTALQALEERFNISVPLAPSEITAKAFEPGSLIESTKFPNEGLNIHQMTGVFSRLGYEIVPYKLDKAQHDFFSNLITAYIDFGIPIIAILDLTTANGAHAGHSVVISGYKYNHRKNKIVELYIHDDNIGPYSSVIFKKDNIFQWENEWVLQWGYKKVNVEELLIPLYHKIRLNFTKIYFNELSFLKKQSELSGFFIKGFLMDINEYKKELLQKILPTACCKEPAEKILTSQLPKFCWVIRIMNEDSPISDLIFDATTNIKKERIKVDFV